METQSSSTSAAEIEVRIPSAGKLNEKELELQRFEAQVKKLLTEERNLHAIYSKINVWLQELVISNSQGGKGLKRKNCKSFYFFLIFQGRRKFKSWMILFSKVVDHSGWVIFKNYQTFLGS